MEEMKLKQSYRPAAIIHLLEQLWTLKVFLMENLVFISLEVSSSNNQLERNFSEIQN